MATLEFTIKELLEMDVALGKLIATAGIPAKVSYRFGKLAKKVGEELHSFYDARTKLIKQYGVENAEDKSWKVPPENEEAYRKEIDNLLAEKFSAEFLPVEIDELGDKAESVLTPMDYAALEKLLLAKD